MFDRIGAWRHRYEGRTSAIAKSVVTAAMIAGCSYVPDSMNPVEWYKGIMGGDDAPEIASPRRPEGSFPDVASTPESATRQPQRGLSADRENAKYAEAVRREPAPTKQLARKTPAADAPAPQVAQAAPQDAKGGYQPSLDRPMRTARDDGPAAPPKTAAGGPPARAEIPDSVPTRRTLLSDHYQRRLAESAAATNKNDPFVKVPPARTEASYNQPVHTYAVPASAPVTTVRPSYAMDYGTDVAPQLVPPRSMRGSRGARGAVVPQSTPAASFQVATIQLAPSGELTATDRATLKDVVALQRKTGGTVRVLGYPSSEAISFVGLDEATLAAARANAIAKTLVAMGIPARKVMASSETVAPVALTDTSASISIEY
ncbi:conserved hypothetical protein [Candidatus Terasakiella magnetica]|nr:conserved hypothetical protein [Candidatus Terasakiella magnetica]